MAPSGLKLCVLNALSWFIPKFPFKQIFSPSLIVSDEAELEKWKQDQLVSRGKASVGYLVEITKRMNQLPSQLLGLKVPALMLWGTGDKVVSEQGHEMVVAASKHQASRLIRYPGGFHNLLAEPALKADVMSDIESWMAQRSQ